MKNNILLLSVLLWLTLTYPTRAQPTEMIVDQQPEYVGGGMEGFYRLIAENLRYPTASRRDCRYGVAYVNFVVNQDGSTDEVYVLHAIDPHIDAEAVRAVQLSSGQWQPGEVDGQPVRVRMILPITFSLGAPCENKVNRFIRKGDKRYRQEDYYEAIGYFDAALTMEPSNPLALTYKGLAYLRLNKLDEACDVWKRAMLDKEAQQLRKAHCPDEEE